MSALSPNVESPSADARAPVPLRPVSRSSSASPGARAALQSPVSTWSGRPRAHTNMLPPRGD
ncbi:hypothetical protein CF640_36540 [Burkholderia pseudomallei]|nr:hypothetical protein CF640_36540 [Burkholderia pseudomallei]